MKTKLMIQLTVLACVAGVMLLSTSCVTSTAPDGAVTKRVDQEAVNPWLVLVGELFVKPVVPVPEIVPEK